MFLLQSLIVSVIAVAPIFIFLKRDLQIAILTAVSFGCAFFFINWIIFYLGCFSTAFPVLGVIGVITGFELLITALFLTNSNGFDGSILLAWFPGAGCILLIIFINLSGCEMINAAKYAALIGPIEEKGMKQWARDNQPIDQNNIRLVPENLAKANATLVMNNGTALGSIYSINSENITLQKINNKYFYLIPLDYSTFGVWSSLGNVDGYIKVSATDPYAKAELITGKKMRYTPGAYFGDNLERHIYRNGYAGYIIDDYSFESDDKGNIYWVVTVEKPSIASFGAAIKGVLLVDPVSGEIEFQTKENVSAWIDRVIPADLTAEYLAYWGELNGGWWNSFWTKRNITMPETPVLNYTSDGRCVFVTPVTSKNDSDNTMVGIVYTDARTGVSTFYKVPGGATEEAIEIAVNSAVSYKKWHASTQMVYENIFGNLSALVPILSEGGNYQGLAIVETQNKRVAFGYTPAEALREFERILATSADTLDTAADAKEISINGVITRIGWDMTQNGKQYYFMISGSSLLFMGTSNILSITKEGDSVEISFMSNAKGIAPVMVFRNRTISK